MRCHCEYCRSEPASFLRHETISSSALVPICDPRWGLPRQGRSALNGPPSLTRHFHELVSPTLNQVPKFCHFFLVDAPSATGLSHQRHVPWPGSAVPCLEDDWNVRVGCPPAATTRKSCSARHTQTSAFSTTDQHSLHTVAPTHEILRNNELY